MKSKATTENVAEGGLDTLHLDEYVPHRLSVTSKRVSRLIARRYSETFGLTISELGVLTTIGRVGTMSPTAVGEATAMDKVKVSRAAASLVARGLVKQTKDPSDGRGRLLRLTRKGTTVHNGIVPLAKEIEGALAAGLSKTEWVTFNKTLVKLSGHLEVLEDADTDH